jgi:hypothetical protein
VTTILTADLEDLLSLGYIQSITTQLATAATSPLFLEPITRVREATFGTQLDVARETVQTIKDSAGPFPDGFRITTRRFETPRDGQRSFAELREGVLTVVHADGVIAVSNTSKSGSTRGAPRDPQAIRAVITRGIAEIGEYVATAPFRALLSELYALPLDRRGAFVEEVVLNSGARNERGLMDAPPGLVIQRSEFADSRPTLFCVSKVVPLAYPWHKVTITFDNDEHSVVG